MLLLVGVSVRALIESAAASGYRVRGIDFFGDADALWHGQVVSLEDLGKTQTVKNLFEVAKTIPCSGLVYASGPENTPEELHFWESRGLLCGNEGEVLKKVRDPWRLQQCLNIAGVAMPPFYSPEQWNRGAKTGRWLLKVLNRGSCHGITELPADDNSVQKALAETDDLSPLIIQEYIEGISASATFLANGKEAAVLGTSRQLIGRNRRNRSFSYEGNIVPLDPRAALDLQDFRNKINEIAKRLTSCFALKGINTVDFILNAEGIWILEVNPRWSGSVELIERARGKSLFGDHLTGCKGRELPRFQKVIAESADGGEELRNFIGKKLVFADKNLSIGELREQDYRSLYEQGVRDIPRAKTEIAKGQPLCTVLVEGISDQDCFTRLQEKSQLIHQYFEKTGKAGRAILH